MQPLPTWAFHLSSCFGAPANDSCQYLSFLGSPCLGGIDVPVRLLRADASHDPSQAYYVIRRCRNRAANPGIAFRNRGVGTC